MANLSKTKAHAAESKLYETMKAAAAYEDSGKLEEWQEEELEALRKSAQSLSGVAMPFTVATAGAAGTFFLTLSTVLPIGIGAMFILWASLKTKNHLRRNQLRRKIENVTGWDLTAPFLSGAELDRYTAIVPPEIVIAEMMIAEVNRFPTPKDAKKRLKKVTETVATIEPADEPKPTLTTAAIGSKLKIGASIGEAVMAMLRCSMICAPPRCGKGVATVVVILAFKQAFPAGWVGSCTIKQYQGEHWYWQWSNRHINPNTGRNLDGTYADKVAAAKLIYSIYREWEAQPSSKAAPALLVIDELVDTLGHLSEVECSQVAAELPKDKTFADWLRSDLITSATLNQCHHRYLLLVSPVNTASGMGFKNASSLTSYAAFILASREDASFTPSTGGSIFAAPAIPDNLDWDDWYAVAYSSKKRDWFGIPAIPAAELAAEESKWAGHVYEGSKWAASAKLNSVFTVETDGVTNEAIKVSIQPDPPTEAVSAAEYDDFQEVLDHALDVIGMTDQPITLTRICPMSRARSRHRDKLIQTLASMPEISYYTRPRGNVIQHFFEQKKEGEDDESFVDQLLIDDDEQV